MFVQTIKEIVILVSLFCSVSILSCTTNDNYSKLLTTSQQTNSDDSAKSTTQKIQGKLIYQEIPPGKSVRAYKGEEFFLITNSENQAKLILFPSEKMTRSQLKSFDNQSVEITAIYQEGNRPDSTKFACPIDNNRQCIIRGQGYRVLSVEIK